MYAINNTNNTNNTTNQLKKYSEIEKTGVLISPPVYRKCLIFLSFCCVSSESDDIV